MNSFIVLRGTLSDSIDIYTANIFVAEQNQNCIIFKSICGLIVCKVYNINKV